MTHLCSGWSVCNKLSLNDDACELCVRKCNVLAVVQALVQPYAQHTPMRQSCYICRTHKVTTCKFLMRGRQKHSQTGSLCWLYGSANTSLPLCLFSYACHCSECKLPMLVVLTSTNCTTCNSLLAEGWSYAKPIGGGVVLCKNAFLMITSRPSCRTVSATVNRLPRIPIHVWSRTFQGRLTICSARQACLQCTVAG